MSRRVLIGSAFGAIAGGSVLLALINRGSGGGGTADLSDGVIDLRPTLPETVDGLEFLTAESDFFVIDTVGKMHPRLEAGDWSLRIHGMVDKEVSLAYDDITRRASRAAETIPSATVCRSTRRLASITSR